MRKGDRHALVDFTDFLANRIVDWRTIPVIDIPGKSFQPQTKGRNEKPMEQNAAKFLQMRHQAFLGLGMTHLAMLLRSP